VKRNVPVTTNLGIWRIVIEDDGFVTSLFAKSHLEIGIDDMHARPILISQIKVSPAIIRNVRRVRAECGCNVGITLKRAGRTCLDVNFPTSFREPPDDRRRAKDIAESGLTTN
jgi:hypothetical protein